MAEPEKKVEVQPPGSQKAPPGGAVNTPAPVAVDTLLRPSDTKGLRKRIYDHTFEAIQNLQPVSNSKYSLHVENPRWIDPETWSPSHQKKTFYQGGTLARRIQGDYVLKDLLTDKEVSRKSATVASVPHLNDRGLFLLNGSHWHLGSQTRLDPGIYPKIQDNGEFKAMVNPSGGRQHSLTLDPESGVFHFEIGSSRIPLMSVLRSLGVDNKRFHDEWGRDLVEKNAAKADPSAVRKLVEKLYDGDKIPEGLRDDELLTKKFGAMKLDPYVMKQTIGHAHESYDSESMLRTAKRLLALSRGEVPPSERDHQAFQHVLGQEHLFAERAKNSRPLLNQALWKATYKGNLDNLPSGLLNQHLAETITATGLGVNAQMTNPAEMLDAAYRVSKMGKGGVSCYSADTEVYTEEGWKAWPEVTVNDRFACCVEGKLQFNLAEELFCGAFSGTLLRMSTKFVDLLVTPDHRHYVQSYGDRDWKLDWGFRTASDVHGKKIRLRTAIEANEAGQDPESFWIDPAPSLSNRARAIKEAVAVPFVSWVELMAAYLADGSFSYSVDRNEYRVEIGKELATNPTEVETLRGILAATGLHHRYDQNRRFIITGKHLAYYVSQFGKSRHKFVPLAIMQSSLATRKRFVDLITTFDCAERAVGYRHYQSASKRLRDQVAELAISCGFTVRYSETNQLNRMYTLRILEKTFVGVSVQKNKDQYQEIAYTGNVYCARVPGGLLFVRRNGKCCWSGNSLDAVPDSMRDVHSSQFYFVDPIVTPESGKAGVDSRFSAATARDKQGRIYTQMYNRDGSPRWMTARDTKGMTIAPWESRNSKADWVEAIRDGEMAMVPRSKVDVFSPPTEMAFSPVANMVPFKSASPAHRTAMGARMITQALPLINAESPHVQSGSPMGGSFEQHYGKHFGAIKAEQAGRVMSVGPESIKVKYMNGETADINLHKHDLYDHAPGRKTHFTHTPMVKPGDFFKPDQLLAKSNYTDNEGRAALGLNLRTAWLPARNAGNFEDAFAFSESAAKRMMSDHMALHSAEEPGMKFGKTNFRSLFPAAYTPEHLKNLDDNGVVKPGAIVKPGQPLVLATRESKMPRTTLVRSPKPIQQDVSEVWDHDYPGEVVDVVKTKSGYRVSVKSAVPMADADKVSGRHGNKGIVTIVPDHQMPIGEDGKPFEVLVSPYSLPSRKNTSQIAELLLGKIAHKHGKKYELPDFQEDDLRQYVANELQKHGMKATESITDPVTGTKIPGVLTGHQFLMKLHHLVETKLKQRDTGSYDSFGTPAKGGSDGAKRMSQADTFALLAHRAEAFLRGTQGVRGQRNEHFWEAVLSGHTPPTPGVSNQYRRMVEGLRASGIHPVQENGKLRLTALTDKDVDNFAGDREIKNPGGLDWGKDGEPVPGGLFDKGLHGEDGSRWSKLSLHTPMPNPAFEDAIRYTLGLTEKQMRGVLAGTSGLVGRKHFDPATATEPTPHGYVAGPQAIHEALRSIDLPKEMAQAVAAIQGNKKTKRDEAIRKYKFLKGAEDQKLHPADWMLKAMPVLPPNLRPVSKLEGSNTELVSDPNYLYQDLFHANKNLRDLSARTRDVAEERLALYDAMKAVTGLGDPINPKHQQKGVKGIMKMILGESPKWSLPQHKLMSTPVDLVGRSTVGPDSSLDMDEVGIPEKMAFTVYKRFVEKRLVRNGMAPVEAVRAVREQAPEAKRALMQEMEVRPVSYHRAPVLHKYGHIGGWPKLVKGDVIKVSPFVIKGLGMDFDGDTANIHVPVYDKEIEDVRDRMMPSRNLLSAKDFQVHYKPEREFHVGLWQATQGQGKEGERERVFDDINAVRRAFARGEITVKDKVTVMKH